MTTPHFLSFPFPLRLEYINCVTRDGSLLHPFPSSAASAAGRGGQTDAVPCMNLATVRAKQRTLLLPEKALSSFTSWLANTAGKHYFSEVIG